MDLPSRWDPAWIQAYGDGALSVFYFMARATQTIETADQTLFVEDAFYLLDSCLDNVLWFFKWSRENLKDLGASYSFLPAQKPPRASRSALGAIQEYRNVLLHNPVLIRRLGGSSIRVPVRTQLDAVKHDWVAGILLDANQWVDVRELLTDLRNGLLDYMRGHWRGIIEAFNSKREGNRFERLLKLSNLLPIRGPCIATTTYSGNQVRESMDGTPTAADAPSASVPPGKER